MHMTGHSTYEPLRRIIDKKENRAFKQYKVERKQEPFLSVPHSFIILPNFSLLHGFADFPTIEHMKYDLPTG